jgi:hypothetical protein
MKKPWVKGIVDSAMDFEIGIFNMTQIGVTKKNK